MKINGETIQRTSDFINHLYTVAVVPEDIELIKGSASDRRRFLDITLSQFRYGYMGLLQDYNKALKSRNQLLKKVDPNPAVIRAFDEILIDRGAKIIQERIHFFEDFEEYVLFISDKLLDPGNTFKLKYTPSISRGDDKEVDWENRMIISLGKNLQRDLMRGTTHSGPHRDDFGLYLNDKDLSNYGSEGQCRISALILKMAKTRLLSKYKGRKNTILLVDDVIGELDQKRRKAFFNSLEDVDQVFLACTSKEEIAGLHIDQTFEVKEGTVNLIINEDES